MRCSAVLNFKLLASHKARTQPAANPSGFKRRIVYYGSKLIADQAPKGNRKKWDYKISEVIVIVLIDGFLLPESEPGMDCVHDICLCNRVTGKVFYENLSFLYIELLNFTKQEFDLQTDLEKWLFVLKNMRKMDKLSVFLRKPIFLKLFEIAKYSNLKKEEKDMYDVSLKRKWDTYATLNYAREEGREEGRLEGKEEGREAKSSEVVTNLIAELDLSDEDISRIANVSLAFVQEIRENLKNKKSL